MVAYLECSKGWLFWVPHEKRFIQSAMARFVERTPNILKETETTKSDLLGVVVNRLSLGDFSNKKILATQEAVINQILATCAAYNIVVPKTFNQAMKSADWEKWKAAIERELLALDKRDVWEALPLPEKKAALDCQWVFAIKKAFDSGDLVYKARCVAKGFKQQKGIDFNKTFAPTATFVSLRVLLTLAAHNNWPVYNFDFAMC